MLAVAAQLALPGAAGRAPARRRARRRTAPSFLFLLGSEVVSPRPGQRESRMYAGPQEDAFASTSSQRLFLKAN